MSVKSCRHNLRRTNNVINYNNNSNNKIYDQNCCAARLTCNRSRPGTTRTTVRGGHTKTEASTASVVHTTSVFLGRVSHGRTEKSLPDTIRRLGPVADTEAQTIARPHLFTSTPRSGSSAGGRGDELHLLFANMPARLRLVTTYLREFSRASEIRTN